MPLACTPRPGTVHDMTTLLDPHRDLTRDVLTRWANSNDTPVAKIVADLLRENPKGKVDGYYLAAINALNINRGNKAPTPDEADLIVELHLHGHYVVDIATLIGRHKNTCHKALQTWRTRAAKDLDDQRMQRRADNLAKLDRAWQQATSAAYRAAEKGEHKHARDWLAEARQTLAAIEKLTGAAAPARQEITGKDGGPLTTASPLDAVLARLATLTPPED